MQGSAGPFGGACTGKRKGWTIQCTKEKCVISAVPSRGEKVMTHGHRFM